MTASAPPGGPSDVPATPSPPDANLCNPEALDWRKLEWTKGGCSFLLFCPGSFDRAVMVAQWYDLKLETRETRVLMQAAVT